MNDSRDRQMQWAVFYDLVQAYLIHRVRQMRSLLRLRAFDVSNAQGNSKERYRRILLTTGSSFVARGISVGTALVTVPLTLRYLGAERYGIWMTISSLFAVLSFTDLGIGQGLVNAVASASGRNDRSGIQSSVSNAFSLLLFIAVLCALISWLAYAYLPVYKLFNVLSPEAIRETDEAVLVMANLFALGLPTSVVQRFHEGMQEGFINQMSQMVGSLLGLLLVLFCIHAQRGLPWLVLGFQGGITLATLANFAFQFWRRQSWAKPSLSLYNRAASSRLLKVGLVFFLLTLLTMLGFQTDSLIIANLMGPDAVAPYAVVQKLSQIAFLYWAFTQALWPAYSEAIARGEVQWVQKAFVRSLKMSLVCGAFLGLALVLFGQPLINWWIKRSLPVPLALLAAFGAFIFLNSFVGTLAVVMNSGVLLRQQLLLLGIAVPVCLILKVVLCLYLGLSGPVWASVIAFALFYVVPGLVLVRKTFWHPLSGDTVG